MAKISISGLNEASSEVFVPRPDANYEAVISGAVLKETGPNSQHPGSPMLELAIKLLKTEDFNEQTIKNYYVLPNEEYMDAEQMGMKTREQKRVCVATGVAIEDDGYDPDDMLDQPVTAVVGSETPTEGQYAGKTFNRITDILPV